MEEGPSTSWVVLALFREAWLVYKSKLSYEKQVSKRRSSKLSALVPALTSLHHGLQLQDDIKPFLPESTVKSRLLPF